MMTHLENTLLRTPAAEHWKKIGIRHHHGIALPLFSLRTENGEGIGTFADLRLLVDWCVSVGFDVIQLLPLNDTGEDTSPYGAISAYALNPIHLTISELPYYEEIPYSLDGYNLSQRVQYREIREEKRHFLDQYFNRFGKEVLESIEFQKFKTENPWLESYALFKAIKEKTQWHSWTFWEEGLRHLTVEAYQKAFHNHARAIEFHSFVQYLCFKQLAEVKRYANSKGVFLKGDIPILINRESADVWFHRELFRIEMSAGAPPDMYAPNGQNWGFPIYRWDVLKKENYHWWRERLRVASDIYDLYRIDHVVGFYRIWAIPPGLTGREGEFIPADPAEQLAIGDATMRMMLQSTHLLPIGEDLGVVPPAVRRNLLELGICGTKVIRWERKWNEDRSFIPVQDYIPESMTTVSTHDSETLNIWWANHFDEVREYCTFKGWNFTYELPRDKHFQILRDSHHSGSLFHINLLQEYLALVPGLTWPDMHDERINIPGRILETNWTYRIRPTVEQMMECNELNQKIRDILQG